VSAVLETERLVLRLPSPEDAAMAAEYIVDPEVMRYIGGETAPPEEAPATVERWLDRWEQDEIGPFMLERRSDGVVVGRVGFLVWDTRDWHQCTFAEGDAHAQPELGWTLVRAHWGQGYATEAAIAVRDWGRRERGIGHLVSLIEPTNTRSQAVARRLGAEPTETVRLTAHDGVPVVVWVHPA